MKKIDNLRSAQEKEQASAVNENELLKFKHTPSSDEKLLLSFKAESHEYNFKGLGWYIIAGIFTVASVIYFISEGSFTSAIVFVLIYSFMVIHGNTPPPIIEVHFTDEGMYKNKTFYSYNDMKSFWITNSKKDNIHSLHINIGDKIIHTITIQLHDMPDYIIKKVFEGKVEEDFEREHPTHLKIKRFLGL